MSSHIEATNKTNEIRAIFIESLVKESNEIKEAIGTVNYKRKYFFSNTSCKSCIDCCKNTKKEECKHVLRNEEFENISRNLLSDYDNSTCQQMVLRMLPKWAQIVLLINEMGSLLQLNFILHSSKHNFLLDLLTLHNFNLV